MRRSKELLDKIDLHICSSRVRTLWNHWPTLIGTLMGTMNPWKSNLVLFLNSSPISLAIIFQSCQSMVYKTRHHLLQAMSTSLLRTLQAFYWKWPLWQGFHTEVETLVRSIADYTEYLVAQNKTMKILHAREKPVQQISVSSMSTRVSCPLPARFTKLNEALMAKDPYQYLFL